MSGMYLEIAKYLTPYKDNLDALYQWKFDEEIPRARFGISINGESWLQKTRDLKTKLGNKMASVESDDELVEIADYFIKDWGGIKRFTRSKELVTHFKKISGTPTLPDEFNPPYKSVSSWSKWVSLICPKWACIYDARVAYSLNIINYLSGGKYDIFPMPAGRNTRLNMLDVSTLLISSKIQTGDDPQPKALREKYFVAESEAYEKYIELIRKTSSELWEEEGHMHDAEMILFSIADSYAYKDLFAALSLGR